MVYGVLTKKTTPLRAPIGTTRSRSGRNPLSRLQRAALPRVAVCGVLLLSPLLAGADKRPPGMTASSIPMPSGVAGEVRVVVNAPAARVAAIASDPAAFRELFPAEEARVVGQRDGAVMVAVRKREGWPVGELRWVETVARARSGATLEVTRDVIESTFFKRMHAVLQVTPVPGAEGERSVVQYRVDVDINRWAPIWVLRRNHLDAMVATTDRLRRMSERGQLQSAAPSGPREPGAPAVPGAPVVPAAPVAPAAGAAAERSPEREAGSLGAVQRERALSPKDLAPAGAGGPPG